jgi:iron complex transport system substrate-binding protein
MPVVAVLALALFAAPAAARTAGDLPRVASTTLCGDQYLLKLADPGQIVSLSRDATDPRLSLFADRARNHPVNRGTVEEMIALDADVVIVDGWAGGPTARLLERFGVRVVPLPIDTTFDGIARTTRRVAAAIGHPERGAPLVAGMRRRLARLAKRREGRRQYLAAYLWPSGGSAGSGTFIDTVFHAVGLRNLAAEMGESGWGQIGLETLVRHPPDLFVTSFFAGQAPSEQVRFARHPVARRLLADTPTVEIPGKYWVCSAWFLLDAAERLDAAVRGLAREDGR